MTLQEKKNKMRELVKGNQALMSNKFFQSVKAL